MEKTAPCMAIVEKKGHRTGGCMNTFFQFFEWNRKFYKKNLFPKKLLLRAGEEQLPNRFGNKEKMPKPVIHLIADGYTGGFPSVKKKKKKNKKSDDSNNDDGHHNVEPQHDTRSPGLVARLMGLESMPAFTGQNQKLDEDVCREDKPLDDLCFPNSVDAELESRLQKPLKKVVSDRRLMTRFGEEGLHIKDVLSRPRRHNHHPKLPSQLKSPRGLNTQNHNSSTTSSRLINVATRILEPGLQAKNRARYTLTHSDASHLSRSKHKANKTAVVPPDSEKGSLMGKRLVGEQCVECPASTSKLVSVSSLHSPEKNEVKPVFIHNVESNRVQTQDLESNSVRMRTIEEALGISDSQSRRVSLPSSASTLCEAKDLIASNWSLSSKTGRTRHPSRTSRPEFEFERRFCTRQDDSLSLLRTPAKRQRNESRKRQFANSGHVGSQLKKNENVKGGTVCVEEADRKLRSRNCQPSRRSKNVDTSSSASGDRTKETSKVADEKGEKYLGKQMALNGDDLGALLDQTLKELTCEGEEETNGTGKAKRSTAAILQDLISALTTEQLVTKHESKPDTEIAFQTEAENEDSSLGCAHRSDCCRPGTILEASSTCTCFGADTMQPKAGVQDSANSIKTSNFPNYGTVTDLTDRVSHMLIQMNDAGIGLKGGQLTHAQDVILNAEILFLDSTGSVAGSSLLDQITILGTRNWRPADCLPWFEEIEKTDPFNRAFFFDSLIECLDSNYSMCGYFGINTWRKFPSHINVESLVRDETGRWMKLAGKSADEIIEWEMMNCSFGKWSHFDAEVFETGVETSSDILQCLLEEFVIDLWISR